MVKNEVVIPAIVESNYDTAVDYISTELDWSKTTRFVDRIDSIYYQAILTNFEEWHDPSCPIIPDSVVDSMIVEFEVSYPLAAIIFDFI